MATYNPPPSLFERQVQSLRGQSHTRWLCLINDDCSTPGSVAHIRQVIGHDGRFRLTQNNERLGFYRNFERCLTQVPPEAAFVALADQDDYWYEDKLESLLARFEPGVTLVYSDMNLVDETGRRLAGTFWTERRNQYTDLAVLLHANTVTGAASMLRRGLLDDVLPFPLPVGPTYHDHWIGCVALALGEIRYLDRPLYDYVRHSGNVTQIALHASPAERLLRLAAHFNPRRWADKVAAWYGRTSTTLQRGRILARMLEERCGGRMSVAKRQQLRRLAAGDLARMQFRAIYGGDRHLYYRLLLEAGRSRLRRLAA